MIKRQWPVPFLFSYNNLFLYQSYVSNLFWWNTPLLAPLSPLKNEDFFQSSVTLHRSHRQRIGPCATGDRLSCIFSPYPVKNFECLEKIIFIRAEDICSRQVRKIRLLAVPARKLLRNSVKIRKNIFLYWFNQFY